MHRRSLITGVAAIAAYAALDKANAQMLLTGAGKGSKDVPVTYDKWDASIAPVTTGKVVLSNSDLTAAWSGVGSNGNWYSIISTSKKSTGKWYYEYLTNVDGYSYNLTVGAANSSFTGGTLGTWTGTTNSVGLSALNGHIYLAGSDQGVGPGVFYATIVCGIALDMDNQKIWIRTNSTNWNGNGGTNNPATNTGGISISSIASDGLYASAGGQRSNQNTTANFGASAFSYSLPSGFSAWTV